MRALNYFFTEAAASLWRGRRAATLAILTITVGLFLLGFFLLVNANVSRLVAQWSQAAEMSVYLADDASPEARAAVEATLAASPLVAHFEYRSKTDALARFKRDFKDLAGLTDELGENPLPASFEVRLRPSAGDRAGIDAIAASLAKAPGVADVRYDRQWLDRLLLAVALLRGISLVIITIVAVAAALTVANVVRLAAYARLDEIEIMHLVGLPAAFIRGPFVVEGILQGGLGSLAALVLLWAGYTVAAVRYGKMLSDAIGLDGLAFFSPLLVLLLVAGGMAVGCVGGMVAARSVH